MEQVTIPMAILLDDVLHSTAKTLYAMLVHDPEITIEQVRERLRRPNKKAYSRKYLEELQRTLVSRGYLEVSEHRRKDGRVIERHFPPIDEAPAAPARLAS